MSRLSSLHFRQVPGVDPDSRITLSPNASVLLGRDPQASGQHALQGWLAAVLTGDFSQTPDAAWALDVTFRDAEGDAAVTFQREAPGTPVVLLREGRDPLELSARAVLEGSASRSVFSPEQDWVGEVGPEGSLRDVRFLPLKLRIAHHHRYYHSQSSSGAEGDGGEVARLSLKHVPELASLWFHLDYERGEVVMDEAGAVSFAFVRSSGAVEGVSSLTTAQRRFLNLHYFLSCQGEVALLGDVLSVVPDEEALGDVLRLLMPEWGQQLAARQSVMMADTSRLLYGLDLRTAEAVQACAVLCLPESAAGRGWRWRDLTDEEARRYFQFYAQGFAQIDSLIRLW